MFIFSAKDVILNPFSLISNSILFIPLVFFAKIRLL
nr:MAG TPA: hypothetical protein [Caudoviricetes sp.]DAP56705.1 MAG TPA: hypothetical protein [Caudoviricetes sp.]DAZ63499.1 MAG TPA: hypothetical protein [Caudoviricetes sp.]